MKLAIISVLLGALSGTAFAGEATKPVPQGYVTIIEVPVVMVEAKRWTAADEQALQKSTAAKVASGNAEARRDVVAYVAR